MNSRPHKNGAFSLFYFSVALGVGALLAVPPLAGIGTVAGVAGAAVNIGSNTTEYFVTKDYVSEVQEKWEEIRSKLAAFFMERLGSEDTVITILKIIKDIIEGIISLHTGWDLIRRGCLQTENPLPMAMRNPTRFAAGASRMANAMRMERTAANAARGFNRACRGVNMMGKGAFFVNVILLPINIYDLYNSASVAISGGPSEASAKLGRIADFLEKFATGQLIINY